MKEPAKTNFGPEEDEIVIQLMQDLERQKKEKMKQELEAQISERKTRKDVLQQLERSLD